MDVLWVRTPGRSRNWVAVLVSADRSRLVDRLIDAGLRREWRPWPRWIILPAGRHPDPKCLKGK